MNERSTPFPSRGSNVDEVSRPCSAPIVSFSRRGFLRGAGLVGVSWLTPLSGALALAAEKSPARPGSLIVLWLQGGASQLETFDPHPDRPIASGSRAIRTAVKDLQFGEGLEQTAELAQDFSVLRSVVSEEGDHSRATYQVKTGYRLFPGLVHPSIGAVVSHELPGSARGPASLDIPSHLSILPSIAPGRGGYLGARYDAFQIGDPGRPISDVRARVADQRHTRRLRSLDFLESTFAEGRLSDLEESRTLHRSSIARAEQMMTSSQLKAFDLSDLPRSERDPFGDTAFGRGCLAAMRLVEEGVRCVEVTLNGWDSHINNHETHLRLNGILDPALASLIRGLKARDLYDQTVVLVGTEFGRTPRLNLAEGRDHWPHGFSILLGGGGLRGGVAVGQTDPEGGEIDAARPIRVDDVHATILRTLGVDHEVELMTPIGRPLPLSEGRVIPELVG